MVRPSVRGDRLDRLVHDLLDLARRCRHFNAADVDVREILTERQNMANSCDRDGVTLTLAEAARPSTCTWMRCAFAKSSTI